MMILEQLYKGNIGPVHLSSYKTERYKHYTAQAHKLEARLEKNLDEGSQRLLQELLETKTAADTELHAGEFIHGFKLAVLIMAESFMDTESELLDPELYWHNKLRPEPLGKTSDTVE